MSEHIHKLKKHKYKNGTTVFFCTNDCTFKVECELAVGKRVLCNICGQPFVMNEASIKMVRPHCSGCGKTLVKLPDGRRSYVDKRRINVIAKDMAESSVDSLKNRLSQASVVQMASTERDEDI